MLYTVGMSVRRNLTKVNSMEIISNRQTANPIGEAPTFDNNALKKVIVDLVDVMKTDFGQTFKKQFTDDESLTNYKRRLYQKLDKEKYTAELITAGYERFVAGAPTFPPSVPVLINYVEEQVARAVSVIAPSFRLESKPQNRGSTVDGRTVANEEFNASMVALGREDLVSKDFYTKAEIKEMRAQCKQWLKG